jgi:glutaminase
VFERLSADMELHMMHVAPTGESAIRATTDTDGDSVIELQGDLRFAGAESVISNLEKAEPPSGTRLSLDFSNVRAVDDAARRLLHSAIDLLREDGHDVSIEDPHGLMEP